MAKTKNSHLDNLLEVERHLQDLLDFINGVEDATFGGIKLRLRKHIQQDMNWIAAQTGNMTNISNSLTATDLLNAPGPKMIMGKPIGRGNIPVTAQTVTPPAAAAKKFSAKVDDLYKGFIGMKDNDLVNLMGVPGGEALIRGVAKLAGVSNWETLDSGEIDFSFFADIREGIKEKAQTAKSEAALSQRIDDADIEAAEEVPDEAVEETKAAPVSKKAAKAANTGKKASIMDDDDE